MTSSQWRNLAVVLFSVLLAPTAVRAAAIEVNGTCELGTCGSPGTLVNGTTIPSTPFSFFYTAADGDKFLINGSYSSTGTGVNFPTLDFAPTVTFLGNPGHTTSGHDMLTVDLLENFTSTSSLDGTYAESFKLTQQPDVAAGSSITAEVFFGGKGIGPVTYSGIGTTTLSATAVLTGLGDSTTGDEQYIFNLAAGSTPVPEPADFALVGLGLAAFIGFVVRGRKKARSFVQ